MQSVDVSVTTVWQFGFICRSEPRPMVECEESRCTRSLKRDSSSLVVVRMTVMSFRVKPVGWRGIPNYYCRRFFDTLRLRMTCILVRDSSLRLRYVQNDKLVQTERGLTYALRDKIPMREKSRKEKVCIYISLVRKAVLSTEIVIENLLRCCKRTLFGIENHTFFFSQ